MLLSPLVWGRRSTRRQSRRSPRTAWSGASSANCQSPPSRSETVSHSDIFRPIPLHGNVVDINLTVLHRNFLGVDEFLGQISLPLKEFDVYERPKSRWLPLRCKPGQNKSDYRGEIEARGGIRTIRHLTFWAIQVKIGFTVKATNNLGGSAVDLSKKKKGSITSLHKVIFPGC